ncbi:uncharacterized protein KIAA2012-like isoform X1 [Triticum dicoccoides]|uniref:uncharacterized protein KIAA2012-like isoform X1 n=3 Tax=Triticum dicoccoides TaxID=85692 RepID=UPI0018911F8D|nr:uncharacterized protein KIAA2012-like isoform X1 [Triticum dicoccoides]XP_037450069.1 uncharacterized protein KIAA2012-like isoform X1 [Triticum dicoccoides]
MTASTERTTSGAWRQSTMMNFTEDAPVKKGSVLLTRMESITAYKNQRGQPKFGHMGPGRYTRNRRKSEKVFKIAKERYRGWRSTLSSTYKSYKTDAARLANLPEDLQPEEWEWMIEYFGTDSKFQEGSQKNADNRKKQKTKHIIGSKSYSQVSFEKRNLETGEEPDCIALWELTHTNNGTWSNTDSQKVYDQALEEVKNKEAETEGPLSSEQKNNVFQTAYKDTLECKSSQPRGYGYMAKTSTDSEKFRIQIEEQARATAATQERNSQLSQQVNDLEDQLQAERANTQERINLERAEREQLEERLKEERAERERLLQEERTSRLEFEKT